jgi:aminomethyltransferase
VRAPSKRTRGAHTAAQAAGKDVALTVHDDRGLLALQGPSAPAVLQKLTSADLSKLYFGNFARFDIAGVPCWVTRTG